MAGAPPTQATEPTCAAPVTRPRVGIAAALPLLDQALSMDGRVAAGCHQ